MKNKLFRLTLKRKLILEDIATTVRLKLEHYQKEDEALGHLAGFGRMTAECIPDEQKRKERIEEYDQLEEKYQLCWEVIWITLCHNDVYTINQRCNGGRARYVQYESLPWEERMKKLDEKDERGWYNEFDIPLEIFNQAIDDIVELLKYYEKTTHNNYEKQLDFLQELRDFRNECESDAI